MFERKHIGIAQLNQVAKDLITNYQDYRIFAFYGKMGSGKTTFIREICRFLGSGDTPTSPSFTIVNEYFTSTGVKIYHFDFYRIKKSEEVYDLGYEDYFFSGNYCLIEWPEKIDSLLPEHYIVVNIEEEEGGMRRITAKLSAEYFVV